MVLWPLEPSETIPWPKKAVYRADETYFCGSFMITMEF